MPGKDCPSDVPSSPRRRRLADVMIMPAAQKPHSNGWRIENHCCIGWSFPSLASPSRMVTSRPTARNAGTRQVWTGMPSSQTVQAPQSPGSHPFFTPTSQGTQEGSQASPGRGSAANVLPLTTKVIARRHGASSERTCPRSNTSTACGGAATRARRQIPDGGHRRVDSDRAPPPTAGDRSGLTERGVAAVMVNRKSPPLGRMPTRTADRPRWVSVKRRKANCLRSAWLARRMMRINSPGAGH